MSKHFIIDPSIHLVGSEVMEAVINEKHQKKDLSDKSREERNEAKLKEDETLQHAYGRVIIKIDLQSKNFHTFQNGLKIRRERQFNEFNRRQTEPVNAIVISAENIPAGREILIGHNALHDSNRIFSYKPDTTTDVKYFSIPDAECFAWRDIDGEIKPMTNFEFGLRVFKPYKGVVSGIPPTVIEDVLFVTTGKLKGSVANLLKSSDYTIIYQDTNGRENQVIRFRHSEDENFEREEVVCVNHYLTKEVNNGGLLIGYTPQDAKTLNNG